MQKFVTPSLLFLLVASLCFDACVYHEYPEYVCTENLSYAEDIRAIVETKCAVSGCHNGDMGSDLNWTNFEKFHQRASNGMVKYRVTNHIMPPANSPAGPLSREQINAIVCWSDQGALDN